MFTRNKGTASEGLRHPVFEWVLHKWHAVVPRLSLQAFVLYDSFNSIRFAPRSWCVQPVRQPHPRRTPIGTESNGQNGSPPSKFPGDVGVFIAPLRLNETSAQNFVFIYANAAGDKFTCKSLGISLGRFRSQMPPDRPAGSAICHQRARRHAARRYQTVVSGTGFRLAPRRWMAASPTPGPSGGRKIPKRPRGPILALI
jgi:hypothetical protein